MAKIPKAMNRAGVASLILAFVASPTSAPTKIVTNVAEKEFNTPPNWINWLPLLPPPPRVLSIGLTTVLSIHIQNPAMNAPVRYMANALLSLALPEKYCSNTPMNPTTMATRAVFL